MKGSLLAGVAAVGLTTLIAMPAAHATLALEFIQAAALLPSSIMAQVTPIRPSA